MINIDSISKEVANELGISPIVAEQVIRHPWKRTKDLFIARERRPILHIYLGKFYMKKYKSLQLDHDEEFKLKIAYLDEYKRKRNNKWLQELHIQK